MPDDLAARLQMLMVVRWLDAGSPDDGVVECPLDDLAAGLDLGPGRAEMLRLMGALGDLEERGDVHVAWTPGRARAMVTLTDRLRRDVRMLAPGD